MAYLSFGVGSVTRITGEPGRDLEMGAGPPPREGPESGGSLSGEGELPVGEAAWVFVSGEGTRLLDSATLLLLFRLNVFVKKPLIFCSLAFKLAIVDYMLDVIKRRPKIQFRPRP